MKAMRPCERRREKVSSIRGGSGKFGIREEKCGTKQVTAFCSLSLWERAGVRAARFLQFACRSTAQRGVALTLTLSQREREYSCHNGNLNCFALEPGDFVHVFVAAAGKADHDYI